MAGRYRAAADLSYAHGQALRHSVMLEAFLTHGLDTQDVLVMLAHDMKAATEALTEYRNAVVRKQDHDKITQ